METTEVNFKSFMTVEVAARMLGISKMTLRKWSDENKIISVRHPINNYRLYHITEIERVLCLLMKK